MCSVANQRTVFMIELDFPTSNHSKQMLIGHVWYITILTWICAFQDKLLYLVVFSLYSSLFWELKDKRNLEKIHVWPESLRAMSEYWYIERGQIQSHVCARHFFVVKYFFNSSPCSYHGLFYGHAMFIGNSQKEASYLSFPVFTAVQFIASKV